MGKKKSNSKKPLNAFKVSEGRAQKAKKNKSNINFKKFKTKTNEEVDKLNNTFNGLQKDVRTAKQKQPGQINPRLTRTETAEVNLDEAINKLSHL